MSSALGIDELAQRAASLVTGDGRAILGVAGAPGAGKTTFVEALVAHVAATHPPGWVAHLPMDGYHLADAQLDRLGSRSRKGASDTFDAHGYAHTLERVRSHPGEWIYVPGFERTLEQPIAAAMVIPPVARLVVTEGNYLLLQADPWPKARAAMDQVWYVTTDQALRIDRLVARHVRFGKSPDAASDWVNTTDETNAHLVVQSSSAADLVVANTTAGWVISEQPAQP